MFWFLFHYSKYSRFSACQPSLACKVVDLRQDPSSTFDSQLAVMEKMQTQFRNCFAVIIIDLNDNTTWDRIQLKLKGGLLRLFAASTFETTSSIILDYYKLMKNSSKLQQQSSFFEKVMSNISFQILCVTIPLIINSITISFFVIVGKGQYIIS